MLMPDVLVVLYNVTYVFPELVAFPPVGCCELVAALLVVAAAVAAVDWGRSSKESRKNRKRFVGVSLLSSLSTAIAMVS